MVGDKGVREHNYGVRDDTSLLADPRLGSPHPVLKGVGSDMAHSRVVVVSPYAQMNVYLESALPRIIDGCIVDVVSRSDAVVQPYIDVSFRERSAQSPLWIIDFGKIISPQPSPLDLRKARLDILSDIVSDTVKSGGGTLVSALEEQTFDGGGCKNIIMALRNTVENIHPESILPLMNAAHKSIPSEKYVDRVVPFDGYALWSRDHTIARISPIAKISADFENAHSYDSSGHFNPSSVSIGLYVEFIESDLRMLARGIRKKTIFSFLRNSDSDLQFFEVDKK